MTAATTTTPVRRSFRFSRGQSIALVFSGTVLGAAAQVLIKTGANMLPSGGFLSVVPAMATNLPILAGYSLYGLFTVLLVLALRDGELSILYPVIALTYVWVTILSVTFFRETMNPFKVAGIMIIVVGVAVLGRDKGR